MCPSMADSDSSYIPKPKKVLSSEVTENHANPSKYFHHFLYKAIIVTIFLVIVPLLPPQAPKFVAQNLHSRSWELLQIIFVGIAVSYGLFSSKRNDETDKENSSINSTFDNAQSYVARILQVSSVFDVDTENPSVSDDNKIQTWNSQYQREEPVVVVAKESPVVGKQNGFPSSRTDEKPLLLPVRSLKSRVSEMETSGESSFKNGSISKPDSNSNSPVQSLKSRVSEMETSRESSFKNGSISQPNSNSGSKRFLDNSRKSRNGEFPGLISPLNVDQENMEENVVVLPSPIPWRSRSGRIVLKEDEEDGLTSYSLPASLEEDSELKRSQSFRSSTSHSPKTVSPLPSISSESQTKSVEDVLRRKIYVKSLAPPAPPPPPSFIRKSFLQKSNSSLVNGEDFPEKVLRRSVRSTPNDSRESEIEVLSRISNSGPNLRRQNFSELQKAEKKEYVENVVVETERSSDDYSEESLESSGNEDTNAADEGPDVDKKADEFIAKFREQIRLQRIESIRRSTTEQHARKQSR
ncbi:hypothetical protein ACH5RR_038741 [Cinchona calisaya]|uniref:Hydroxyproline-rich glycoprotein family protein n=1 Tax=Cinchona calisaya TaxID=153742 RepID=A0ABD2XWQ6_9GENT